MSTTDSALLIKVREEFVRRGHARNVLQDADGHVCLMGAYGFAISDGKDPSAGFYENWMGGPGGDYRPVETKLARGLGFTGLAEMCSFNNTRPTEEVVGRLDDAIARAQEMESGRPLPEPEQARPWRHVSPPEPIRFGGSFTEILADVKDVEARWLIDSRRWLIDSRRWLIDSRAVIKAELVT